MEKIPTAEELLDNKFPEFEHLDNGNIWVNIENIMIEFAKLHVKAALKEALDSIPCLGSSSDIATYEEVEEAVLNSYSLENIK
jgi:hypothetical protein